MYRLSLYYLLYNIEIDQVRFQCIDIYRNCNPNFQELKKKCLSIYKNFPSLNLNKKMVILCNIFMSKNKISITFIENKDCQIRQYFDEYSY